MPKLHTRRLTSNFFIGLFVIGGLFLLVFIIIWLGATQFLKENTLYVTYFEGSVEGLETGSSVKYLGMPIGTVSKIDVAPDGKLIEIIMQIDPDVKMSDSVRVKAELAGIAGGKFLQLHFPGDPVIASMYPRLNFKPPYPVIKSSPSGIDEIEIATRDVLNNLRRLRITEISNGTVSFLQTSTKFFENPEIYEIISDLKNSAQALNNILTRADTSGVVENLEITSQKLLQITVELEYFTNSLNNEIDRLDLPEKVANAFNQYDSAMVETRKTINVVGFRTETILFSINETLEQIKLTNKQLRKSLRALTDDPSQVLFSEPPPPEK